MFRAEELAETLVRIDHLLTELGVRHHFTGGIAASFYGEPRLTQDLDVVVDPAALLLAIEPFFSAIESTYLFTPEVIRFAVHSGESFQLLDKHSMIKIDCYPREMVARELDRSVSGEVLPSVVIPLVSEVDAIISKLMWIRRGSHKSRRDARGMIRRLSAEARANLFQSAESFGLGEILTTVEESEGEID